MSTRKEGYCAGFCVWSSPSSSVGVAGDTADSKGCVWSEGPHFLSPDCSTKPLPYRPDYCKDQKKKGLKKYYHYVHVSVPTIELYDKDVHVAVQKSGVCKMLYCLKKKITKAASIW